MTEQPKKLDLSSHDIAADKLAALRMAFPEVFTEGGKVDFDKLKMTLGESVDVGKERYGMNWPGKAECFKTIQRPSMATLIPAPNESVNFDTTQNLIIEGDNLEVLKLLQKSYLSKVKMIYIDPPYNTGNDFIYPDNYSESLDTYLRYTGQVDSEGRKYSTNTEADGRFHSKWLNMMYPRLHLARNLLRDDGVIFISIGQAEFSSLVSVCNEIFGEENRISICTRLMKTGGQKGKFFSPNTDYVLVYAKNIECLPDFRGDISEELIKKVYTQVEEQGSRKGERYRIMGLYQSSLDERANQRYIIACPDGELVIPPGTTMPTLLEDGSGVKPAVGDGVWRWIHKRFRDEKEKGNIIFKKTETSPLITSSGQKSVWNIYTKIWLNERLEDGSLPLDMFDKFENRHSSQELTALDIPYDFAKPTELMQYLAAICGTENDDIILDFFAGSATTGHATLKLNKDIGGNRKFILVQLPEPTERQDYPTITEITKERVRRAIKKLNQEDNNESRQDRGFKVFKLQSSNFKAWNAEQPKDDVELAKQLTLHVEHLVTGRTQDDVLYELLLKSGFPLNTPIEKVTLANKTVFSIADGMMMVCLENNLTLEVLKAIADKKPERVVCLDAGFANNDQLKTNAVQTMKAKGVTKFQTV